MRTFILAGISIFALGLVPAAAGPCTAEIENLNKTLSAKDARSGPTSGSSGPTAAMGEETKGKAVSPEDVRRQAQGQPTAAETGRAAAGTSAPTDATAALERARMLDQQGKEAECMESVRQAKGLAGPK